MLTITLPEYETFSEEDGFVTHEKLRLHLEHSLYSISLYESKWKKAFFKNEGMTPDDFLRYISCMPIEDDIPEKWVLRLDGGQLLKISDYISDSKTATTVNRSASSKGSSKTITSEIVYFWMTQYGIPFECDRWHFSRLMTLIEVASVKNGPQKKMSKKEVMLQQQAICEANRKKYNSRG